MVFYFFFSINSNEGKPSVVLEEINLKYFQEMGVKMIHLSLSHEEKYSLAFIILEG